MASQSEKAGAPTIGNAFAYFAIWWVPQKYGVEFDDPVMAALMAGAIITWLLLQIRSTLGFLARIIERKGDA